MRRTAYFALACALTLLTSPRYGSAGTLKPDGRAGSVTAAQGLAFVRPVGHERWTALDPRSIVFPGDVVRTEARGANAIELRLASGGRLVAGPRSLLEFPDAGGVRLLSGEVEVTGTAESPVHVTATGGFVQDVGATAVWLRANEREAKALPASPAWLTGYRASTSEEWMGSLLATVDGKNVPLSVGYHKVTVEIRDQIARTTVEESFVNATDSTLEGVFSFPLPADASISGFGMWIGQELVEADLVEKQRAREIYEDILRRKKDPGLLEWEGGNLFKARVYPITPRGEKRIRLRYTQLLPLEGDGYRYRYALRSELLRQHPVRELSMEVRVISAATIRGVESPTHPITMRQTGNEAIVEFSAREYSPDRDFEVAVSLERGEPLTALAHCRGDDGFFSLLLSPPGAERSARDLVPEGEPLDLLIVADTSGSMDRASRATQAEFLSAMLSPLSSKDRFRLLAFDVSPVWLVEEPVAATPENVEKALSALEARRSLGWTDLPRAWKALIAKAKAGTQVIFVGDGIQTAGDGDPVATLATLREISKGNAATFHAVSTSSAYERSVLEGIASLGGGSVRRAEEPQAAARALLGDVARPGVRDLHVEVRGVTTAKVYPEVLPNLPLGQQQIVLGRFLPSSGKGAATVVATGTLAGKPVRYESSFAMPAAEEGNSFLPRLWARRHLDALLAEGRRPGLQEEIVAFSREYEIMTPYTSFLVLENDEDRAKYGVERTVHMRDAERFFASARDKAGLEIARKQSQVAKRWRLGLRSQMRAEIARLGRDLPAPVAYGWVEGRDAVQGFLLFAGDGDNGTLRNAGMTGTMNRVSIQFSENLRDGGGAADFDVEIAQGADIAAKDARRGPPGLREPSEEMFLGAAAPCCAPAPTRAGMPGLDVSMSDVVNDEENPLFGGEGEETVVPYGDGAAKEDVGVDWRGLGGQSPDALVDLDDLGNGMSQGYTPELTSEGAANESGIYYNDFEGDRRVQRLAGRGKSLYGSRSRPYIVGPSRIGLRDLGIPGLATSRPEVEPPAMPDPAWDPRILHALRSLDRRPRLATLTGGLRLTAEGRSPHPLTGRSESSVRERVLWSPTQWATFRVGAGWEPIEQWTSDKERGIVRDATRLGRKRAALPGDRTPRVLPLSDASLTDVRSYFLGNRRTPSVDVQGDKVTISFPTNADPGFQAVLVIDTTRGVLLEARGTLDGKVRASQRFSDFVEVAGSWWARTVEDLDEDGHIVHRQTLTVEALEPAAFSEALASTLSSFEDVVFATGAEPSARTARGRVRDGQADLQDHLVLALHQVSRGRFDAAWKSFAAASQIAGAKPGVEWMRLALLPKTKRDEEAKTRALRQATVVASDVSGQAPWRARALERLASVLGPREKLAIFDALRPAYASPSPDAEGWALYAKRREIAAFDEAGMAFEARTARARLAAERPWDTTDVLAHAGDLHSGGDARKAVDYVRERSLSAGPWTEAEADALFSTWALWLFELRDLPALEIATTEWSTRRPRSEPARRAQGSVDLLLGKADALDARLLAELGADLGDLDTPEGLAKRTAAIQLALGEGWGFRANEISTEFRKALADLGLRLLRSDGRYAELGNSILSQWRFGQTEEARALRATLLSDLAAPGAAASMPIRRLQRYGALAPWGTPAVTEEVWRRIIDAIVTRWRDAAQPADADAFASIALAAMQARGAQAEKIAFLRERANKASPRDARAYAHELFDALLAGPKSAEVEAEVAALLPRLVDPADEPAVNRSRAAGIARTLADWIFKARSEAAAGTPQERASWSRAEAARKAVEATAKARRETAARLGALVSTADATWRPWLELERLGYAAETLDDLAKTEGETRELLDSVPAASENDLDGWLARRCAVVLSYAATRRSAPEGLADRVLALFRKRLEAKDVVLDDRYEVFRLLVALDRVADLETTLSGWIQPDDDDPYWRVALAYIQAESDRVREAVTTLESAAMIADLDAGQEQVLAGWYLVLKEDAKREAALDRSIAALSAAQIQQRVWSEVSAVSRSREGVPPELDPETLRLLRVGLAKSDQPMNLIGVAQQLYSTTKDFRILEWIADACIGRSPETTYSSLNTATNQITQVFEEATLDAMSARAAALLAKAATDTDRRTLQLLIAALEMRAGAVPKADPAHASRAVAALRAAHAGGFVPGERALMAGQLGSMGVPRNSGVSEEQRRVLAALLAAAKTPLEALEIGRHLAGVLWAGDRRAEATRLLDGLLAAVRKEAGGTLPSMAEQDYERLIGWWEDGGQFRLGEDRLKADFQVEPRSGRKDRLLMRRLQLYVNALTHKGTVSAGSGAALFESAAAETNRLLEAGPDSMRDEANNTWGALHVAASKSNAVANAGARYEAWVRERLPALLARSPLERASLGTTATHVLADLQGPRAALGAAVDLVEKEPSWVERIGQDAWSHSYGSMADWRVKAGSLGDIEPRLRKIVLTHLERSLLSANPQWASFWWRSSSEFWASQAPAFSEVAARVAEVHAGEPVLVLRVAEFQHSGLEQRGDAIATLLMGLERAKGLRMLREPLAQWLHDEGREAESKAVVESLIIESQDDLRWRLLLVAVLHGMKDDAAAGAALDAAVARWKETKAWNANVAASLGAAALEANHPKKTIEWIENALQMRREAGGGAGPDRVLSSWYGTLSKARSKTGDTDGAIQAASAAVVAWGANQEDRSEVLIALRSALEGADLTRWIERHDAEVAATGLDSPLLRKIAGQILLIRGSNAAAVVQLRAALDLDPVDTETQATLVRALDAAHDGPGALEALLAAITQTPKQVDLYPDLARRYVAAGDPANAERARTNLVEVMPNDPEGHRALAKLREWAQEWAVAARQWAQVARVRPKEPEGWLMGAKARIAAGDLDGARSALQHVTSTTWDPRFDDAKQEAAQILQGLR